MTRFDIGKAEGVMAEQSAAETEVRAAWGYAELYRDVHEVWVAFGTSDENTYGKKNGVRHITSKFESPEAAWLYAYAITSAKHEEIRQLEREIRHVEVMIYQTRGDLLCSSSPAALLGDALADWRRTLARLEAALVELRRGMKQEEEA